MKMKVTKELVMFDSSTDSVFVKANNRHSKLLDGVFEKLEAWTKGDRLTMHGAIV